MKYNIEKGFQKWIPTIVFDKTGEAFLMEIFPKELREDCLKIEQVEKTNLRRIVLKTDIFDKKEILVSTNGSNDSVDFSVNFRLSPIDNYYVNRTSLVIDQNDKCSISHFESIDGASGSFFATSQIVYSERKNKFSPKASLHGSGYSSTRELLSISIAKWIFLRDSLDLLKSEDEDLLDKLRFLNELLEIPNYHKESTKLRLQIEDGFNFLVPDYLFAMEGDNLVDSEEKLHILTDDFSHPIKNMQEPIPELNSNLSIADTLKMSQQNIGIADKYEQIKEFIEVPDLLFTKENVEGLINTNDLEKRLQKSYGIKKNR